MCIVNKIDNTYRNKKAQNNYIERVLNKTSLKARRVEVYKLGKYEVRLVIDGIDYTLTTDKISKFQVVVDDYGNTKMDLGYTLHENLGNTLVHSGTEMMIWKK